VGQLSLAVRGLLASTFVAGELAGKPGISDLLGQSGQRLALPVGQPDFVVAHRDLLNPAALVGSYPARASSTLDSSADGRDGCSQT
jgi:hypothetical protein